MFNDVEIGYFQGLYIIISKHYETNNPSKLVKIEYKLDRTKLSIDMDIFNLIYSQLSILLSLQHHDVILKAKPAGGYEYLDIEEIKNFQDIIIIILDIYRKIDATIYINNLSKDDITFIKTQFLYIADKLEYVSYVLKRIIDWVYQVNPKVYHDQSAYLSFIHSIISTSEILFNRYRTQYMINEASPVERFIHKISEYSKRYILINSNYSIRQYKKMLKNKNNY